MKLHARYSPARHAWLATVARGGASRPKGITGFYCMRLGWTEWRTHKGRAIDERLTEVGRALLFYWNHQHGEPRP